MAQLRKKARNVCAIFRIIFLQLTLQFCWRFKVSFSRCVAGHLNLTPRSY